MSGHTMNHTHGSFPPKWHYITDFVQPIFFELHTVELQKTIRYFTDSGANFCLFLTQSFFSEAAAASSFFVRGIWIRIQSFIFIRDVICTSWDIWTRAPPSSFILCFGRVKKASLTQNWSPFSSSLVLNTAKIIVSSSTNPPSSSSSSSSSSASALLTHFSQLAFCSSLFLTTSNENENQLLRCALDLLFRFCKISQSIFHSAFLFFSFNSIPLISF